MTKKAGRPSDWSSPQYARSIPIAATNAFSREELLKAREEVGEGSIVKRSAGRLTGDL